MSLKILEVSDTSHPVYRFLSFYSQKLNLNWTLEHISEWLPEKGFQSDLVLVDLEKSPFIMDDIRMMPAQIKTFGCFDTIFRDGDYHIPRNLFFDSLETFFIEQARDLDNRAPAFVVGDRVQARVIALFLASRGIRQICLVGNVTRLKNEVKVMARAQIGVQFTPIAPEELTLQTMAASILVNTADLTQDAELMTDLSYFNYMKRDAYVLDLFPPDGENPLLEEAQRAGLRILDEAPFIEVFARDCLKRLGVDYKPSVWEEYRRENYP